MDDAKTYKKEYDMTGEDAVRFILIIIEATSVKIFTSNVRNACNEVLGRQVVVLTYVLLHGL